MPPKRDVVHIAEVVVGSPGMELVTFKRRRKQAAQTTAEHFQLPLKARIALKPILEQLPRLMAVNANSMTYLTMHFSPEVAKQLLSGTLELSDSHAAPNAFRAFAKSADGRIVEHASFTRVINPAAVVTVAWHIAAFITAQKFLSDINTKLSTIQRGIESIQSYLENDTASRLQANFYYLQDRAAMARTDGIALTELNHVTGQLESIDRETRAAAALIQRQLDALRENVAAENWKQTWSASDAQQNALIAITRAEQYVRAGIVANQVRLLGAVVRNALGLHIDYTTRLMNSVADDLETLHRAWDAFEQMVREKTTTLGAAFQLLKTNETQRAGLRHALIAATDNTKTLIREQRDAQQTQHEALTSCASSIGQVVQLDISLDENGELVEIVKAQPHCPLLLASDNRGNTLKTPWVRNRL